LSIATLLTIATAPLQRLARFVGVSDAESEDRMELCQGIEDALRTQARASRAERKKKKIESAKKNRTR
jgi:hypothetical protein